MDKRLKALCKWSPADVVEFLKTIHLENYSQVFLKTNIDGIKLKSLSPIALLSFPYFMKEDEANLLSFSILDLEDDQNEFGDFNFERTVSSADLESFENTVDADSTSTKQILPTCDSEKSDKKENRKSVPPNKPLPLIPPSKKPPPPPVKPLVPPKPPPRTYRVPKKIIERKPREAESEPEHGSSGKSPIVDEKIKSSDEKLYNTDEVILSSEKESASDQKKGLFSGLKNFKFPITTLKKTKVVEEISEPTSFMRVAHYEMNPERNEIEVTGEGGEFLKSLQQAYKELSDTNVIKDIGELWKTYRLYPKYEIKKQKNNYTH